MFVLATASSAQDTQDVWTDWTTLKELYPSANNLNFWANTSTEYSTCEGNRFALIPTNPDYNVQASVLIAAFMAKKEVRMLILQTGSCAAQVERFRVR